LDAAFKQGDPCSFWIIAGIISKFVNMKTQRQMFRKVKKSPAEMELKSYVSKSTLGSSMTLLQYAAISLISMSNFQPWNFMRNALP